MQKDKVMKYIKSFRFLILFLISLYTVLGFVIIPWYITSFLPSLLKQKVGINLQIQKASFNPYSFELNLQNVTLKDLDEQPALKIGTVYVNYSPLGLMDKTFLFQKLRIQNPQIFATLGKNGKINFQNIFPTTRIQSPKTSDEKETQLPNIVLRNLRIDNGQFVFNDKGKDFTLDLGPYNFSLHDLSTRQGSVTSHHFETKMQNNARLVWDGGLSIKPLSFYGTLHIQELQLPSLVKYALKDFPTTLQYGKISLNLPYQIDFQNGLKANVNDANLDLKALTLQYDNVAIVDVSDIKVDGINLSYPKQEASVKNILITRPSIVAILDKNKQINFANAFLLPPTKKKQTAPSKPWQFLLKNVQTKDARVKFFDNSIQDKGHFELNKIFINVQNISSDKTLPISYTLKSVIKSHGNLNIDGNAIQNPLHVKANFALENLELNLFQNYIKPFAKVNLTKGALNFHAKIDANLANNDTKVRADTSIDNLRVDTQKNTPLLSWKKFALNNIKFDQNPMSVEIGSIKLDKPFVKLQIAKDHTNNFTKLLKQQPREQSKTTKTQTTKNPIHMKFGKMQLNDAKADFSDLSLPFPFRTKIHSLNGKFSELDLQKPQPSNIFLEGKIDKYGYTKIKGSLTPLALKKYANLDVIFKNIDLTSMTPYSGKFVGYKIQSGKISMDLHYDINKASLVGSNKINIDTLNLGEKVKSKDALNLPLGLAIALLKDSNGQIDIDLPVTGDMNNPKFSYGGVIWRAFGNLITGIVTAPFRFLGNMLGIDGEKLKNIDFALGSTQIIVAEEQKLENLEKILGKRPGIKLSIEGTYDKTLDAKALREQKFQTILNAYNDKLKEKIKDKKADTYSLSLKDLYLQSFTKDDFAKLEKSFVDKKSEKIDITALNAKIFELLSEKIKVTQKELEALAKNRANAIKNELSEKYKIAQERVILKDVSAKKAKRDEWVQTKLDITN
jgi:hypothetical protein